MNTDINHNRATAKVINEIFKAMIGVSPAFRQAWPSQAEMTEAKYQWTLAFQEAGLDEIHAIRWGMKKLRAIKSPFPPSPAQFIEWCDPSFDDMGMPTPQEAYSSVSDLIAFGYSSIFAKNNDSDELITTSYARLALNIKVVREVIKNKDCCPIDLNRIDKHSSLAAKMVGLPLFYANAVKYEDFKKCYLFIADEVFKGVSFNQIRKLLPSRDKINCAIEKLVTIEQEFRYHEYKHKILSEHVKYKHFSFSAWLESGANPDKTTEITKQNFTDMQGEVLRASKNNKDVDLMINKMPSSNVGLYVSDLKAACYSALVFNLLKGAAIRQP